MFALAGLTVLALAGAAVAGLWLSFAPAAATTPAAAVAAGVAPERGAPPAGETAAEARARIAAEPMASVDPSAAFAGEASLASAGRVEVPEPGDVYGPAGVVAGFPRTPGGALAQLAAIEEQVYSSMCVSRAREVWDGWAAPGAEPFDKWRLARDVAAFLSGVGGGDCLPSGVSVRVAPAAGMVKGSVGEDWAAVCVLLDVDVRAARQSRMGYGYCAAMAWIGGRWMVADGDLPEAPHTLPGTVAAVGAGWLEWAPQAGGD
ncbi:MAG: hypothetical protein LBR32_00700 [Propionibacteriaceae bacterium]|jgi:hypothetical protein|nr:hypothetical protein [Propionibacteriaceae bacterium]